MIFIRTLIPHPLLIAYAAVLTYVIVCTLLITPLIRRFALRHRFIDKPGSRRIHQQDIPNIGGIAFAVAFLSGLWISSFFDPAMARLLDERIAGLIAATLVIITTGLVDDARGLNFIQKFSIQIVVGLILYGTGYRITALPDLFGGSIPLGWLSIPVTILWISAMCNAINLIDGLDGLAAGIVSIACAILFAVSVLQHDVVAAFMTLMLAGIAISFLYYNFYPAKIFMGDTGSLFLGMVLSCIVIGKIDFTRSSNEIIPLVVVLGVPVFDMVLTIVRRALKKRHLFRADRLHVHHRLMDVLGMSHRQAVLTLYGWSFGFGSIGVLILLGQASLFLIGCGAVVLIIGYATLKLRYFQ